MNYTKGNGVYENWIVSEEAFNPRHLGKCETIMALGNGYLGVRSATEEHYVGETRNTFIAGTFNRFDQSEVTELPNCPDVFQVTLELDGYVFRLDQGELLSYDRQLNLKEGSLQRKVLWKSPNGKRFEIGFSRFVSLKTCHLTGQSIEIKALDDSATLKMRSGINGQVTNSGVQHFSEGEKRVFENTVLQMVQRTTESNIDLVVSATHAFYQDGKAFSPNGMIAMDRRKIFFDYEVPLQANSSVRIEKFAYFITSRDKAYLNDTLDALRKQSVAFLLKATKEGYAFHLEESKSEWDAQVWHKANIEIVSKSPFDQLAMRFAQYHLRIMTPYHDSRMNIGAKGLTGEGYKGHTFWDTEIFILPYYIYSHPEIARKLLKYRYLTLSGAHKKAQENGFEGAMFPWESAWLSDGEVTPVWGAADIVTGKSTKIWSGFIEQHITADVAFAIWQYYNVSGDEAFMCQYGYEVIFDTAIFWASRLEFSMADGMYHINNVIGPDEYKEHIDDNAFTNHMAAFNLKIAIQYYERLQKTNKEVLDHLEAKLNLREKMNEIKEKIKLMYLPQANEEGVIPQDNTYLSKKQIDLTQYKNQKQVGTLFQHFNLDQVNDIQVSKQADVLILMYLLENQFNQETKQACWEYYEPKTLHDSSLSLSTHAILASDLGHLDLAYKLFKKAAQIDLGPNMKSSDHGIHAASLGGIWQCVVNGFGGVRMLGGELRVNPHLPESWDLLKFSIHWKGERIFFEINKSHLKISKECVDYPIDFKCFGTTFSFSSTIEIPYIALKNDVSKAKLC